MPVSFCVYNVAGYNEKLNTILYREPILTNKNYESKYIIFFPGDYSNFFRNSIYTSFKLQSTYECTDYCYSYEALFWVISSKYLYDHIVFIKPSTFSNYFSTFSNFLNSSDISLSTNAKNVHANSANDREGNISRTSKNSYQTNEESYTNNKTTQAQSTKHLLCLLLSLNKTLLGSQKKGTTISCNCSQMRDANMIGQQSTISESDIVSDTQICKNTDEEETRTSKNNIEEKPCNECNNINRKEGIKGKLILIGFSKGCTVLFSLLREAKEKFFFWSLIDSLYFLDPSFNKNIYNTNIENSALENLSQYNIKIYIHSTPRQIVDESGLYIHKELTNFLKLLRLFRICTFPYIHYTNVQKVVNPLCMHFEILIDFSEDIEKEADEHTPLLLCSKELNINFCQRKANDKTDGKANDKTNGKANDKMDRVPSGKNGGN
ncbi:conserved protein, unknown function [Plasmodium malariae]|uniref:Uncharacterized protein n=1 Tax=Plasmodium malariae TaxID=5858 RepID=A0A1A8VVN5_PLAMA|nr:conserved protein, unknown function [Plasmodium malariae]